MVSVSQQYATENKWLKASDLQKRTHRVVIDRVTVETFDDGEKLAVFFKGKAKGLLLNKTNAGNIAYLYGDETDGWTDQPIEIYPTLVDFQGKQVEAVRTRPPSDPAPTTVAGFEPATEPPPAPAPARGPDGFEDQDIGF